MIWTPRRNLPFLFKAKTRHGNFSPEVLLVNDLTRHCPDFLRHRNELLHAQDAREREPGEVGRSRIGTETAHGNGNGRFAKNAIILAD